MRAQRPGLLLGLILGLAAMLAVACGGDDEDAVTRDELSSVVQQAVAAAVPAAPAPAPAGPSASEVEAIVSAAISAIPAPEPVVVEVEKQTGTVNVISKWGGAELEAFLAVVAPWEEATGGKMLYEPIQDLTAVVFTRVQAGNPPDIIAGHPNPGVIQQLARAGALQRLDAFMDMDKIRSDYSKGWIDLGTVDGVFYGLPFKASSKGTVWYNPNHFAAMGWEVPTTWDEMIALSDQMVAAGESPWSVGTESGAASGWPASDWFQQIVLGQSGPVVYDQLVTHEIPWTHPAVKLAFEKIGEIVHTPGYVPGGATAALATGFKDGAYLLYQDPPLANMYFLGSFTQGFVTAQFPDAVAGEDYSFFPFPTINPDYPGAATGGGGLNVAFNDDPATQSLMKYLASAGAQQIWVSRGGFASPNSNVSLQAYPDEIASKAAEQLTTANFFRFDLDDLLGGGEQAAVWSALLDYIQSPADLDSILENLEAVVAGQ